MQSAQQAAGQVAGQVAGQAVVQAAGQVSEPSPGQLAQEVLEALAEQAPGPGPAARLALFDLDHTLIPFDSGMAWTDFLVQQRVLPADAPAHYLAQAQGLVDGRLGLEALHAATVRPLAALTRCQLQALGEAFGRQMQPRLLPQRLALVQRHRAAGEHCVLVTATTRFIAEVFGRLFGLTTVLATESAWSSAAPDARLTGEIVGPPCWRAHKLTHLQAWLARQGLDAAAQTAALATASFYSDSASDLPLLQAVGRPVAVRPDARLRAQALAAGWALIDD